MCKYFGHLDKLVAAIIFNTFASFRGDCRDNKVWCFMLCCWFYTTTLTTSPSSSSIVSPLLPSLDAPPPALAPVAWAIICLMLKSLFTFFLSMICAVILFAVPSDPLRSDVVKVHPLKREDTMTQEGVWEIIEAFQWLWKQRTKSGELEQFYLLLLKDNTSPGYDKTAYLYPSTGGEGRKEQALPP